MNILRHLVYCNYQMLDFIFHLKPLLMNLMNFLLIHYKDSIFFDFSIYSMNNHIHNVLKIYQFQT